MRANTLKEIWAKDATAVNGWLSLPSGFSAETMAHQGWDSVTVDMQHGLIDYQAAVTMLTAISTTGAMPLVRVPWLDPSHLMKVLDAGAYGVICPMINTRADAERLVAYTRYPPLGTRSFGPIRGMLYGGADYAEQANDTLTVFAMIETREGLDNLDDILATPGLDAVYVGPSDLSLALGCRPTFDDLDAPAADAVAEIARAAQAAGKIAGIHNMTPEAARMRMDLGYRFVTIASDVRLIAAGAQAILSQMRQGGATPGGSGY